MGTITRLHMDIKSLTTVVALTLASVFPVASYVFGQATTTITSTTGVGDLGTRTIPQGQTIQIIGGTRSDQGSGRNLFHSFNQFSVGDGYTAKFLNTTPSLPTDNILSRVTGGEHSNIFGTIDTMSYPGANLFLMNPAGVVFGPNATLNVNGSVAFTTADYLRLANADGSNAGIFRADPRATPQLSSAPVAAFGFLGDNPAAIEVNRSTLTLDPNQSFSLVGGSVTIQSATLADKADSSAPGNQVNIGSTASRGEILVGTLASAANINGELPRTLGTVHISQESTIDTSNRAGGTIRIRGGQLIVDGSNIYSGSGGIMLDATAISIKNSAVIGTYTVATANAGAVIVSALKDIEMDSDAKVESQTFIASRDAGNIRLRTEQGNVILSNGATITSSATNGGRKAGSIEIDAQNGSVRLDNSALIFPFADRKADQIGGVKITANNLDLNQGSRIDSDNNTTQVAGPIDIHVRDLLRLTGGSEIETTSAFGSARAADIAIKAPEVRISGGSKFSADTETDSSGTGGRVAIRGVLGSSNLISIDGPGSGIFTDTKGTGPGGTIDLATQSLTLENSASITASTSGPGNAGNITINSDSLTVASGGRIEASTSGSGNGGSIVINTTGDVTVTGVSADGQIRSGVYAKTLSANGGSGNGSGGGGGGSGGESGTGNGGSGGGQSKPGKAGDITIEAKNLLLDKGAQIDSSTTSGGTGGSVSIKTAENITIAGSSTRLTSDATRGDGQGGNITLVAKNITVHDRASVTAATGGKGDAGNISLTALDQLLLQSAGTITTSTSGSGKGGTIAIRAGRVVLDGPGTGITAATLPPFADLTVTIDILHPNDGDLVVQLDSPTGTRVALLSRVGGSGDNFTHTQFNDQATTKITSGSAPFTGTFTPREPLGQLNKELAAGDWVLNVRDQGSGKVGSLESWTLQIGNQTFQSTGGVQAIPDNSNALRSTITVANPAVPTVPPAGEPTGIGGDIALTADQSVTIQNGASISASSAGPGNAGTVTINAGQQLDVLNGSITTQAAKASGGNIDIKAIDLIRVTDGLISSSVQGGPSTAGGNITIDPRTVVLQGNTQILASAQQGSGGNIEITTPLFLKDPTSIVDASSRFGLSGTVTIQSPTSNLSGTVGQLASKTSPPQVLVENRCVALAGGEQSTFLLAGRDALPSEPGGWLSSPTAMEHWSGEGTEDHASGLLVQRKSSSSVPVMAALRNDSPVLSLRRLTPPGFLVRTFATGTTGCPS